MDGNNEQKELMKGHVQELHDILRSKGYYGAFKVNGGMAEPLPQALERHYQENPAFSALPQLHLTTMTHQQGLNAISASFKVSYSETFGFGIEGMTVLRTMRGQKEPTRLSKAMGRWAEVPTVSQVNQMAFLHSTGKKRRP